MPRDTLLRAVLEVTRLQRTRRSARRKPAARARPETPSPRSGPAPAARSGSDRPPLPRSAGHRRRRPGPRRRGRDGSPGRSTASRLICATPHIRHDHACARRAARPGGALNAELCRARDWCAGRDGRRGRRAALAAPVRCGATRRLARGRRSLDPARARARPSETRSPTPFRIWRQRGFAAVIAHPERHVGPIPEARRARRPGSAHSGHGGDARAARRRRRCSTRPLRSHSPSGERRTQLP